MSLKKWNEELHPRVPAGKSTGGEFTEAKGVKAGPERSKQEKKEAKSVREKFGDKDSIPDGAITRDLILEAIANVPDAYKDKKKRKILEDSADQLRQSAKVAAAEGDFDNDFTAKLPQEVRGEAKNVVAGILENLGFEIGYTKYEDGSRSPTSIKSKPKKKKK